MLGSPYRFHGYSALSYVYKQGKQVRSGQLSLRYALNTRRRAYRVAVVVSRKVDKSAVVRNRIRRRIYELVRELCRGLSEPYDLAFMVYDNQLAELPAEQLRSQVAGLLRKAAIPLSATDGAHAIVKPKESRD